MDGGFGQNRRDFLRALGGAIGVALASDPSALGGLAEAAARHALPSGYVFHRLLTVGETSPGPGDIVEISPGVMINDRSEIIFHARTSSGAHGVLRMRIGRGHNPGVDAPTPIVQTGQQLADGLVVERIAAGDTNRSGTYVTVIRGRKDFNAVYIQRAGQPLQQLLKAGDPTPGGGRYSGSFGDVDIDSHDTILLVARYTLPGEIHHGLILMPHGRTDRGRILLRTGQRIPDSRAIVSPPTPVPAVARSGSAFSAPGTARRRSRS